MTDPPILPRADMPVAEMLRGSLSRGDERLATSRPLLALLVSQSDHSLFAEHIVVRIRAMLASLADQLLRAQAEAIGERLQDQFVLQQRLRLVQGLTAQSELLDLLHAFALEWQLTIDLEEKLSLDPVLSPLMQDMVGNGDPEIASVAMAALSSQARFAQSQRRMDVALSELPPDVFHQVLGVWHDLSGAPGSEILERAELRLRADFDEGASRTSLFSRLIMAMGGDATSALKVEFAGVALFLSALASLSGQARSMATASTNSQLAARLILGLRAAGMKPMEVEAQVLRILPDLRIPQGLDSIGTSEAAQWLLAADRNGTA